MSRPITIKQIQLHENCQCGANYVDQIDEQVRFRDFKTLGIQRKSKTSKREAFILWNRQIQGCERCYEFTN